MIRINKDLVDPRITQKIEELEVLANNINTKVTNIENELKKPVTLTVPSTYTEEQCLQAAKENLPKGGLLIVRDVST